MRRRAVFLDRDGTLNVERGYVHRIEDFEWLPGVIPALQSLTERAIQLFIVTNQAGIAKGLYGEADFHRLTAHMTAELQAAGVPLADVLWCPHHPDGVVAEYRRACDCRKPGTRLLQTAMATHGLTAADTVLIGDRNSDIEAGRALGLTTYLVETGYGREERATTRATKVAADLPRAVTDLLTTWGLA